MTRPAEASSWARRGRTRKVMSRPACSIRPPKYPPMAPAPTTRTRIVYSPFCSCYLPHPESALLRVSKDEKCIVASWFETAQGRLLTMRSPFFPERADFHLESPGALRLLVQLPI